MKSLLACHSKRVSLQYRLTQLSAFWLLSLLQDVRYRGVSRNIWMSRSYSGVPRIIGISVIAQCPVLQGCPLQRSVAYYREVRYSAVSRIIGISVTAQCPVLQGYPLQRSVPYYRNICYSGVSRIIGISVIAECPVIQGYPFIFLIIAESCRQGES